jgi:hypothetical protein
VNTPRAVGVGAVAGFLIAHCDRSIDAAVTSNSICGTA